MELRPIIGAHVAPPDCVIRLLNIMLIWDLGQAWTPIKGQHWKPIHIPMTVSVPNLGSQTFNIAANDGYVFQRAVDENNNVLTLVNKTWGSCKLTLSDVGYQDVSRHRLLINIDLSVKTSVVSLKISVIMFSIIGLRNERFTWDRSGRWYWSAF